MKLWGSVWMTLRLAYDLIHPAPIYRTGDLPRVFDDIPAEDRTPAPEAEPLLWLGDYA